MGSCYSTRSHQMPHPTQTKLTSSATKKKQNAEKSKDNGVRSKESSKRFGELRRPAFGFRKTGSEKNQYCPDSRDSYSESSLKNEGKSVNKGCSTTVVSSPSSARGRFGFKRLSKDATSKVADSTSRASHESVNSLSSKSKREYHENKNYQTARSTVVAPPTFVKHSRTTGSCAKETSTCPSSGKNISLMRSVDETKHDNINGNIPVAGESNCDEKGNISKSVGSAGKRGVHQARELGSRKAVHSNVRYDQRNEQSSNKSETHTQTHKKIPTTSHNNNKPVLVTKSVNVLDNTAGNKKSVKGVSSFGFKPVNSLLYKDKSIPPKSSQANNSKNRATPTGTICEVKSENLRSGLTQLHIPKSKIMIDKCDLDTSKISNRLKDTNENEVVNKTICNPETNGYIEGLDNNYNVFSESQPADNSEYTHEHDIVGDEAKTAESQEQMVSEGAVETGSLPSLASDDLMLDFDVELGAYDDSYFDDSSEINSFRTDNRVMYPRNRKNSNRTRTHSYSSDKTDHRNKRLSENSSTCNISTNKTGKPACIESGGEGSCIKSGSLSTQRPNISENPDALAELNQLIDMHTKTSARRLVYRERAQRPASFPGPQELASENSGFVFKPPRTNSIGDEDETVQVDAAIFRQITQECTVLKTMLLRVKRLLQEDELSSPLGNTPWKKAGSQPNSPLVCVSATEGFSVQTQSMTSDKAALLQENEALREQVRLQQQQLCDQQRTISLLQMQMMGTKKDVSKTKISETARFESLKLESQQDPSAKVGLQGIHGASSPDAVECKIHKTKVEKVNETKAFRMGDGQTGTTNDNCETSYPVTSVADLSSGTSSSHGVPTVTSSCKTMTASAELPSQEGEERHDKLVTIRTADGNTQQTESKSIKIIRSQPVFDGGHMASMDAVDIKENSSHGQENRIPVVSDHKSLAKVGESKSKLPLYGKVTSLNKSSKLPSKTFGK